MLTADELHMREERDVEPAALTRGFRRRMRAKMIA
jgi:hypothetical protein